MDIRDCPDASLHRVHMFALQTEQPKTWEPYISKRCLADLDVCVLVEQNAKSEAIAEVQEWCRVAGVKLLVVLHEASEIDETLDVPFVVSQSTDDPSHDVQHAVWDKLREAHADRVFARELASERRLLSSADLSPRFEVEELPRCSDTACWRLGYSENNAFSFSLALVGPPMCGKSTFLSATLDGFTLTAYEPTRRTEFGSFSCAFTQHGIANVVLIDGPTKALFDNAHAVLCFVNLSVDDGVEAARALIATLDLGHKLVVLVGSRIEQKSEGSVGTAEDLRQIAQGVNARKTVFTIVDPRESHRDLLIAVTEELARQQMAILRDINMLHRDSHRRSRADVNFV
eukprot:CAMPEP_0174854954 /NCGR_PEP_ID=MMETSP1114-20130205/32076_1 /TAXON_ID=312471 /ORGANISM="Neobodo designis, Strain CCAP 1951/1" /LENGTH=343 /DNA_ID=CAMNT_0016089663 /DNA_START=160 /DNA_END=1187 /DNA_ORIENTATION=-